jgi:hypothetical protein
MPLSLHSLVVLFFRFYQRHAELFDILMDNHLESLLTATARGCMRSLQISPGAQEFYATGFIAAGLTQILSDWHRDHSVPLSALPVITEQLLNPRAVRS